MFICINCTKLWVSGFTVQLPHVHITHFDHIYPITPSHPDEWKFNTVLKNHLIANNNKKKPHEGEFSVIHPRQILTAAPCLTASSYSSAASKGPLLASNFALQTQNFENFSASGMLDKMVNISLGNTPWKRKYKI